MRLSRTTDDSPAREGSMLTCERITSHADRRRQ
jgi:hypothetical protein